MDEMLKRVKNCDNLKEMLVIVDEYYKLDTPLKPLSRGIVANQIKSIVNLLKLEKR